MFFTAYVLCSLRLFKLKAEEQTIWTENRTEKLKTDIKILADILLTEKQLIYALSFHS